MAKRRQSCLVLGPHRISLEAQLIQHRVRVQGVPQHDHAFLPVYDGGVDFVLLREGDGLIRKVQLKGRWTIDKKYEGRDLWVAFPIGTDWYLVPHDEMVALAHAQGTKTDSWVKAGLYSIGKPAKTIIAACKPYRFRSIEAVATEAAEGDPSGPNPGSVKPSARQIKRFE